LKVIPTKTKEVRNNSENIQARIMNLDTHDKGDDREHIFEVYT
jgi:hypothetical protein